MLARRIVLCVLFAGAVMGLIATLRLAAVVAATPARLWLVEYPRLVDLSAPPPQSVSERADALAQYLRDAALFSARAKACAHINDLPRVPPCLAVIDDALRASPSSGELWLFRARVVLQSSGLDEPFLFALRRSYQSAPREGWIAAERVVLGLRLYPLLPPDLQRRAESDL